MKRSVEVRGAGVVLTVLLAAGIFFAQPAHESIAAARLPDLTIEKIYLTKDCSVAVVVKNLGPGIVPDEVWTVHIPKSAGVYLYKNGTGWGGGSIWLFDPAKSLQKPGGIATYTSTLKVTGTESIKAVVDLWNVVTEANEGNNSLEMKLTCQLQTGPCCIAGTYDGVHTDTPSATCKEPSTEKFILTINQANCGSQVTGEVKTMAAAGPTLTHSLKGTVTPAGKCCELKGVLNGIPGTPSAGEVIQVKGTLCKNKLGKWYCTNGVYTNPTGCSGKFTLQQK